MDLCQPCVIKGAIESWPGRLWNLSLLSYLLTKRTLSFRVGKRSTKSVVWEGDCVYVTASIDDFMEWCKGKVNESNPFFEFSKDDYWCYADYKYIRNLFQDKPELFEAMRWRTCGLEGYDGKQSTLWIGSDGAHTPCHQDTYGFNFVAQIEGRKKWHLFPPHQTDCLYPTRVPYEESSIFSEVSVLDPDLGRHPRYANATPYVVTLGPEDVLYVPKHWWHFVECLEPSVSVNCWVELEDDHFTRFQEAVSRLLVCRLMDNQDSSNPKWLNPTEELTSFDTNWKLVEGSWLCLQEKIPPLIEKDAQERVFVKTEENEGSKNEMTQQCGKVKSSDVGEIPLISKSMPGIVFEGVNEDKFNSTMKRKIDTTTPNERAEVDSTSSCFDGKKRCTSKEYSFCDSGWFQGKSGPSYLTNLSKARSQESKNNIDLLRKLLSSKDDAVAKRVSKQCGAYKLEEVKCRDSVQTLLSCPNAKQSSYNEKTNPKSVRASNSEAEKKPITLEEFVKCVSHPKVIDCITEVLLNR